LDIGAPASADRPWGKTPELRVDFVTNPGCQELGSFEVGKGDGGEVVHRSGYYRFATSLNRSISAARHCAVLTLTQDDRGPDLWAAVLVLGHQPAVNDR